MSIRPFESAGILRQDQERWFIDLDFGIAGLEVGAPVHVLLWDERPEGGRSDVEEIARVQQLGIEVVTMGLAAEGALHDNRDAFLNRLNRSGVKSELNI